MDSIKHPSCVHRKSSLWMRDHSQGPSHHPMWQVDSLASRWGQSSEGVAATNPLFVIILVVSVHPKELVVANSLIQSCGCFPGGSMVKSLPANAGDMGSISGTERSPWRKKSSTACGIPSTEETGRQETVHGVAKGHTQLSV